MLAKSLRSPKENKREFFCGLSEAEPRYFPLVSSRLVSCLSSSPPTFFPSCLSLCLSLSLSLSLSLYPCRLHSCLLCVPLKDTHERRAGLVGTVWSPPQRLPCSHSQPLCIRTAFCLFAAHLLLIRFEWRGVHSFSLIGFTLCVHVCACLHKA